MSQIERVTMGSSLPIQDRSIHLVDERGPRRPELGVERVSTMPGLRISTRITTASLPDYAVYDLKAILGSERRNNISDGDCS